MTKKVVLIIVIALAAISIFILGIVAPALNQTIITVKVTGVEFEHGDAIETDGVWKITLEEDERTYQLSWKVLPWDDEKNKTEATESSVTFTSSNINVTVSADGFVNFPTEISSSITTTITIKTKDGDITDEIVIFLPYTPSHVID